MHVSTRPEVKVGTATDCNGDITHCVVVVGESVFDALFTQSSPELSEMVLNSTNVTLSVDEVMTVTRASRAQLIRESKRLKAALAQMPRGTIAKVEGGLSFWIDAKGDLVWVEWVDVGHASTDNVHPGLITCMDSIDTDELYAVAQGIRNWLGQPPVTEMVDTNWLNTAEAGVEPVKG